MRRGVLFDLDGTLVDHRAAADAAVAAWAARHGGRREATFQEQRRSRIAEFLAFLGRPVPDADAVDGLFASYLEMYEAAWVAYDDAAPALDMLAASGIAIGVLTNGDEAQQRAKLRAVGLLDRFDCVVASSSLPAAKPDAMAFVAACERLGMSPGSVSYVGDNLRTDALAARQAGLRGVWLDRLSEEAHVQPEATISSLLEIEAILG